MSIPTSITHGGIVYPSISALARAHGVPENTVRKRLAGGVPVAEALGAGRMAWHVRKPADEPRACRDCREIKPRSEFYAGRAVCRPCTALRRRIAAYGKEAAEVLAEHDGHCGICRTTESGGKGWAVDHCHRTGKIRGILCSSCNMAIGAFGDDPDRLRAAIAYLERAGV